MKYSTFRKKIAEKVTEKLGSEYNVRVFQVRKNNDIVLDNLSITKDGDVISPCIYIQYYYARYCGGESMDCIAGEMIDYYHESMPKNFSPQDFLSEENVKNHLVCRLVNTERNADLLKECPHLSFLNLSVIFYLIFDDKEIGSGAIVLRHDNLDGLNFNEEGMLPIALENMKTLLPADFVTMDQLIRELRPEAGGDEEPDLLDMEPGENAGPEDMPLYVLTNNRRSFGAAWLVDPDTLDKISQKLDDDFYVLPSSVHECMILPASLKRDTKSLARMVEEINETQVAPEEVLADNVYLYSRQSRKLMIAA